MVPLLLSFLLSPSWDPAIVPVKGPHHVEAGEARVEVADNGFVLCLPREAAWEIAQKYGNTKSGPISMFWFLQDFHQHWYNGLDLDRFCALEHICEL